MDLILWRHAQAEDAVGNMDDLQRPLTPYGHKQATEMAQWLNQHLPKNTLILCSPALRTRETAQHLGRNHEICPEIAPGASVAQLLRTVDWPDVNKTVLVVGHQPTLGLTAQRLLNTHTPCAVKKCAVWWFRHRIREGQETVTLESVQHPQML